jgi:hypothetical protein
VPTSGQMTLPEAADDHIEALLDNEEPPPYMPEPTAPRETRAIFGTNVPCPLFLTNRSVSN